VVRHGTVRLRIHINGCEYALKRLPASFAAGARVWMLRKRRGERAGVAYCVARSKGEISCTFPDCSQTGALCKHIRALIATGLISGRRLGAKGGA
jgi:hypothetical protein